MELYGGRLLQSLTRIAGAGNLFLQGKLIEISKWSRAIRLLEKISVMHVCFHRDRLKLNAFLIWGVH
jgi:hypothetical protein